MKGILKAYGSTLVAALLPQILSLAHAAISAVPAATGPWWLPVVGAALAAVGTRIAHNTDPPGIPATPNLTVEDGGKDLGVTSGMAGDAAGKGPFKKP